MNTITSRDNRWIKVACSLKQRKGRMTEHRFFIEGFRIITDAVSVGVHDGICFVTSKAMAQPGFPALQEQGQRQGWQFFSVTDSVYDKLKDTKNPQGLAAMVPFFSHTMEDVRTLPKEKIIIYLEDVQDPGNLGTILRTAAAMSAGVILISPDSVDVYNDKTIRSAMGALFKIPVVQGVTQEELLAYCHESQRILIGTTPHTSLTYDKAPYDTPFVVAFGNEGRGLSESLLQVCQERIRIPMRRDTESLNLSLSAGIILYKAWEMKGFQED